VFGVIACAAVAVCAQDVKEFEKRVTEFALPNGLQFVVVERHDVPAVSLHTYVRAGSTDDPAGRTGLANLLEEAVLTGSETIGTKNWAEEKKALDAVELLYDDLEAERNLGAKSTAGRAALLEGQLRIAIDNANRLAIPNAFTTALEESGAPRMSRGTTPDGAEYGYTLPSNRIELWYLLESQRLMRPAFREFYSARDAAISEREKRLDGQALVMSKLAATAFEAHPYRNPVFGWSGDLNSLRRTDARAFQEKHYVPGNVFIAIVGDVNPAEAKRLATQYFASWAAKPVPGGVRTQEPTQLGPKRAAVEARVTAGKPAPPVVALIGYKRPNEFDRDDAALDVLQLMLGRGRTSLLHKELVLARHIAQSVQVRATFPAGRYPNLFLFAMVVAPGHTVEENEKALEEYLNRLKLQPIEQPVIDRAKAQARLAMINGMSTNAGLAALLAVHQAHYGDWRKLFAIGDQMDKVSADDLQRVLVRYFVPAGRTTVYTVAPGVPEAATAAPAGGKQ
jgi:predicted Zn-dependent peptidase